MRKAQDFRNLDDSQLEAELNKLREDLFKARNRDSLKQLDKTHEIKLTRREIAKVLTVMNERASESAQTGESK